MMRQFGSCHSIALSPWWSIRDASWLRPSQRSARWTGQTWTRPLFEFDGQRRSSLTRVDTRIVRSLVAMDMLHSIRPPSTLDLRRRLPRRQRPRVEIRDHGRVSLSQPHRALQPCESGSRPIRSYYLVSNKVASNKAKITIFLHILYLQLSTYMPSIMDDRISRSGATNI